ncbi:lysozyme [Azospirillum agricola]|uniref:glycoside hydrolase family protein n=1 Tax=Azospirillum agricola TaxID=1720247 RepID=UPI001B3BAAA6|nr:lysozyme [Azospirillum agricola]
MTSPVCAAAVDLVKHFEGLYLTAYRCPAGVPTIGFGHTAGVTEADIGRRRITAAQADAFLSADLTAAAGQVDGLARVALTPDQRGALASFVFNLGGGSLASSTLLRLLNAGDYQGAAGQFGRWVYATVDGVPTQLPGLVSRRAAEAALFRSVTIPAVPTPPLAMPQMGLAPAGAERNRVRTIQRIVGAKVDGIYGPATHAAVARWQAVHFLKADGIVGPKTAAAMGIS